MTQIVKCDLPTNSLLHGYIQSGDFSDCYRCASPLDVDSAAACAMVFPGWAKWLLRLRNIAVIPFGLIGALPPENSANTIGPFPIDQRNDTEIILGFDDSHLNFRISIQCDGTHTHAATWVHRNNALGHAYLAAIMPFHILIMRAAIRQVGAANRPENQVTPC